MMAEDVPYAAAREPTAAERLALRSALLRHDPSLETVAQDVLGAVSRIDWVATDPAGAVWVVLLAGDGADLGRLGEGFAHCAWLEARLPDWLQIAPHLRLDPALGVRLLLAAPHFDERTRLAAAAWHEGRVVLAETLSRGPRDVELRPLRATHMPAYPATAERSRRTSSPRFRTALRD